MRSDARIIMGNDEPALERRWRIKRGEAEPEDPSDNLAVQLGLATDQLNGNGTSEPPGIPSQASNIGFRHPVIRWMGATLDGGPMVQCSRLSSSCRGRSRKEAPAEKHMFQLQHNMWVTKVTAAVLSIITGGGKWVEIKVPADWLYQHPLLPAEKKFWRCVENGEPPRLFGVEPPRARIGRKPFTCASCSRGSYLVAA